MLQESSRIAAIRLSRSNARREAHRYAAVLRRNSLLARHSPLCRQCGTRSAVAISSGAAIDNAAH
jgi:hypothetical protein